MDFNKIYDIEIDGIDNNDYPDFCDAYISQGSYEGRFLTDDELDYVNDNYSFVHEKVYEYLF